MPLVFLVVASAAGTTRAQAAPALISYHRRMITPSSSLLPKLTHAKAKDLTGHFPPKKYNLSGSQQHPLLSPWLPSLTTYTPAIQTSPDSFPRRPTFVVSLLWNCFSLMGLSRCYIFREEPSVNATPTQSHPSTSWFHQPLPGILISLLPN